MPEGSIIMWSGWLTDLPDGWKLCAGSPSATTTEKCDMRDQFIMGETASEKVNTEVGDMNIAVDTSADDNYKHEHTSKHSHGENSSAKHSHAQKTIAANNSKINSNNSYAVGNVSNSKRVGEATYTTNPAEEYCWIYDSWWGLCLGTSYRYPAETHNRPIRSKEAMVAKKNQGWHNHQIKLNHDHKARLKENSGHKHSFNETSHTHDDIKHIHTASNQPKYYTLAFIYLEGEAGRMIKRLMVFLLIFSMMVMGESQSTFNHEFQVNVTLSQPLDAAGDRMNPLVGTHNVRFEVINDANGQPIWSQSQTLQIDQGEVSTMIRDQIWIGLLFYLIRI